VPNETRQPFRDGSTDFERSLPGPDRMYPDTDSPPTPVTRERVAALRAALPPPPWEREARYAAAGVPAPVGHYLIRRGGAALVDRLVAEAGAGLRVACFFVGERLKGLRRKGVAVDAVPPGRWVELFRLTAERPALLDAWDSLVRLMAGRPDVGVAALVAEASLGEAPAGWQAALRAVVDDARAGARSRSPEARERLAAGRAMAGLRGRVPAADVVAAVRSDLGGGR
jgi:glutamyl-tRNA(Gln) amidotransferase subunit E